MEISDSGLAFIKQWEKFSSEPYWDDIGKVWTQGYGNTHGVTENSPPITEEQATQNLADDLKIYGHAVDTYIESDINQNQFDALCSLVYNCGTAPLRLTLGKLINQRKYDQAADEFLVWDHSRGTVVDGLLNRRKSERELFLTPTEGD